VLWLGIGVVGCNSLLDVENPNRVVSDDVRDPDAAQAVANGALWEVQAGYTYMLMVYSQASDEFEWCGSRDAFQELDFGWIDRPLNEFSDEAFKDIAPGRWMADEAIEILLEHQANGEAGIDQPLAEAYMWSAFIYVTIADVFEDFTFSDMRVASPPIGSANMGQLYADAISNLTAALALDSDMERELTAMRARTRHAQGVWNLIGNTFSPGNGLVSSAEAAADAAAALAIDPSNWEYVFSYNASTTGNDVASNVNSRLEMRFGDRYIIPEEAGKRRDRDAANSGIALLDPIDGVADMRLDDFMTPFEDAISYGDLPILSAAEMHLIIAENALANNDIATFTTNINVARGWAGRTAWADGGAVTATEILAYERQVELFLQMRRLNDMYRFGIRSDNWQDASHAVQSPGTFFPITKAEIDANCYINPDWPANVPCGG
jgi:hypothetical protein